mgnify:CR=1 FL=1
MARSTHRSKKGKKLLAKRDKRGWFKDIQTWERSSRQDQKRRSSAENNKRRGDCGE